MTSSTRASSTSHARTCCSIICSRASEVCIVWPRNWTYCLYVEKAGEVKGFPSRCQAGLRRDMVKYRRGEGVLALCLPGPQASGATNRIRVPDRTARQNQAEGLKKKEDVDPSTDVPAVGARRR